MKKIMLIAISTVAVFGMNIVKKPIDIENIDFSKTQKLSLVMERGQYFESGEAVPDIDKLPHFLLIGKDQQGREWDNLFAVAGGTPAIERFIRLSDGLVVDAKIPKGEKSIVEINDRNRLILRRALANKVSKIWISSNISDGGRNSVFLYSLKGEK